MINEGEECPKCGGRFKVFGTEIIPIIPDLLGHTSTLATSQYLRIDMVNLKQCDIDIKEVLQND